jgi:hypothetical protein
MNASEILFPLFEIVKLSDAGPDRPSGLQRETIML